MAARRGRASAWDALYADLAPVVLGYLRGRGFPDPEDVLGDTWLEVVRDLYRFEGDERGFRSWVLSIAHLRGIDAARRRARRPSDPTDHDALSAALPTTPDIAAEALDRSATDEVVALLDILSDDQREALLLRLLGGLSTSEIAEATGRSRDGVKALQKRAIARLRAHLEVPTARSEALAAGIEVPTSGRPRLHVAPGDADEV